MEAEVVTQVMGREGTTITIQTTVDLSGSMLAVEDAILASVNEVGVIATQEGLKRFDGDGDPIVLGGIKWYSRAAEEKTYQTPYGEVSVERHLYQRAGGGQTYCPMEHGARIVHTATPRFAKMVKVDPSVKTGVASFRYTVPVLPYSYTRRKSGTPY